MNSAMLKAILVFTLRWPTVDNFTPDLLNS